MFGACSFNFQKCFFKNFCFNFHRTEASEGLRLGRRRVRRGPDRALAGADDEEDGEAAHPRLRAHDPVPGLCVCPSAIELIV